MKHKIQITLTDQTKKELEELKKIYHEKIKIYENDNKITDSYMISILINLEYYYQMNQKR